jgi:hypothetical protein
MDKGAELNERYLSDSTFIPEWSETVPGALQFRSLGYPEYLLGLTDDEKCLIVRKDNVGTAWVNTATSESPPVGFSKSLLPGTRVSLQSATQPSLKLNVSERLEGADLLLELAEIDQATTFIVHDSVKINSGKRFEVLDPTTNQGSGMYMWNKNGTCYVTKSDVPEDWHFQTHSTFFAEKSENTAYPNALQFIGINEIDRHLGWAPPYVNLSSGAHDSHAFNVNVISPSSQ